MSIAKLLQRIRKQRETVITVRTLIAVAALLVSLFPFLEKLARDAIDLRNVHRLQEKSELLTSLNERFRLRLSIAIIRNRIEARRIERDYDRVKGWALSSSALICVLWMDYVLYIVKPEYHTGIDKEIFATACASGILGITLLSYAFIHIIVPRRHLRLLVEKFGPYRRPMSLPTPTLFGFAEHLIPADLYIRCYRRAALALNRRPYGANIGEFTCHLDEEFVRRMFIELEYELKLITRASRRFPAWQLYLHPMSLTAALLSPALRRRMARRRSAFHGTVHQIRIDRTPPKEVLDSLHRRDPKKN